MTNPTQLKYLDAMGIPVWVSRDSVVSELADQQENNQSDKVSTQTANSTTKESANKATDTSAVESILQGLNESAVPTARKDVPTASIKAPPQQSKQNQPANITTATENEIARSASHIVYACGNLQADWMVIGESPEISDNHMNQPYADESGVLLCSMLQAVGIENPRESAYLVNIIKSSLQAVEASSIIELNQLLIEKIKEVKPKMILVVGQLAAQNLLQSKEPLARLRAKAQKHPQTGTDMVVTYYPSYLLSKPMDKRKAWEDLKLAMKIINPVDSSPE